MTKLNACPGVPTPAIAKIGVCFFRTRSVVANSYELSSIATSLGASIEQSQPHSCGPLIQAIERPVRPAACNGYATIGHYDLFIVISSVEKVNGSQTTGGLTQAAFPFPGGTQVFVWVDATKH